MSHEKLPRVKSKFLHDEEYRQVGDDWVDFQELISWYFLLASTSSFVDKAPQPSEGHILIFYQAMFDSL